MLRLKQKKVGKTIKMASKTIKTDIYKYTAAPVNTGVPSGFMDYKRHYRLLIEKALNRVSCTEYSELHHILPKCMNGPDDPANLVRLTAREHFVAHWLLHRAYPDHDGLAYAFHLMAEVISGNQHRYTPSSRAIAEAREAAAQARKGKHFHSKAVKQWTGDAELVAEYSSVEEAAKSLGCCSSTISKALTTPQKHKSAVGFLWSYASSKEEIKPLKSLMKVQQISKTGEIIKTFNSIKEAQKLTGISYIARAAYGERKTSGGYRWSFTCQSAVKPPLKPVRL